MILLQLVEVVCFQAVVVGMNMMGTVGNAFVVQEEGMVLDTDEQVLGLTDALAVVVVELCILVVGVVEEGEDHDMAPWVEVEIESLDARLMAEGKKVGGIPLVVEVVDNGYLVVYYSLVVVCGKNSLVVAVVYYSDGRTELVMVVHCTNGLVVAVVV